MLDPELERAFVEVMDAAFASLAGQPMSGSDIVVPVIGTIQLNQPTNQGEDDGATFYFSHLYDQRYGWPQRKTEYLPAPDDVIQTTTRQMIHYYCQGMGVYRQFATSAGFTPNDVAELAALLLSTDDVMSALRARGLGILRISQVQDTPVINGEQQYERMPSFEFTLTHERSIVTTTPAAVQQVVRITSV